MSKVLSPEGAMQELKQRKAAIAARLHAIELQKKGVVPPETAEPLSPDREELTKRKEEIQKRLDAIKQQKASAMSQSPEKKTLSTGLIGLKEVKLPSPNKPPSSGNFFGISPSSLLSSSTSSSTSVSSVSSSVSSVSPLVSSSLLPASLSSSISESKDNSASSMAENKHAAPDSQSPAPHSAVTGSENPVEENIDPSIQWGWVDPAIPVPFWKHWIDAPEDVDKSRFRPATLTDLAEGKFIYVRYRKALCRRVDFPLIWYLIFGEQVERHRSFMANPEMFTVMKGKYEE